MRIRKNRGAAVLALIALPLIGIQTADAADGESFVKGLLKKAMEEQEEIAEIAELLIDEVAEEERGESDDELGMLLIQASDGGDAEQAAQLLDAGADVNAKTVAPGTEGRTALMWAALRGHFKVAKLLLDAGADVNAVAFTTPNANSIGALQAFYRSGYQGEKEAWTALMYAVMRDSFFRYPRSIVKLLLDAGADVDASTNEGSTALMNTAWHGHEDIARLLIDAGADVDARNDYGTSALMYAVAKSPSPQSWAAWERKMNIARLLIDAGADVNAKSAGGGTALMWAEEKGYTEFAELLREAGARE
ncbi:MAG: ankyrin repeat domain-containing protein [Gammaproteobacteria bacterium]|nr:ankyrin repeat domain-containing protein [Gammaproteobacteria bacterium]MCY4165493.1 ankyrin repeat domain-containing protein [Gammaproteobacteria bacterium]MCY4341345.1 ankyrin repeat domain-containing protein [Gammaproteobacteria bacterium]